MGPCHVERLTALLKAKCGIARAMEVTAGFWLVSTQFAMTRDKPFVGTLRVPIYRRPQAD